MCLLCVEKQSSKEIVRLGLKLQKGKICQVVCASPHLLGRGPSKVLWKHQKQNWSWGVGVGGGA